MNSVKFPSKNERLFSVDLLAGINKSIHFNGNGFSDCENLSYKNYPALSSADMRVSVHNQMDFYNLTSPSPHFDNDGGSSVFSFGDYILLIKWGICGENVGDGYHYVRGSKVVYRSFKKGYHYVICDCLKQTKNSFFHLNSAVLYDEYEECVLDTDYLIYADPTNYVDTDTRPTIMDDADKSVVYRFGDEYFFYDEKWIEMKPDKTYVSDRNVYYYDSYLECWLKKRGYTDKDRDAKIFSCWSGDNMSLMMGDYKKYIVVMPDAVMIELDEKGMPKDDMYFNNDWINTTINRSDSKDIKYMKIHKLNAFITDEEGNTKTFDYPDISCILPAHSRLFCIGNGRIYATKPNTVNDFSYDSIYSSSADNAWAVSVSNEGTASSGLCAIYNYMDELLVFTTDCTYKIYGKTNPFRIGTLFNTGTFDQKSITECDGKLYFADKCGVYCYNGTSVTRISSCLKHGNIYRAVLTGADGILYIYLDCDEDKAIYTYNTVNKSFLKISLPYDSYIESADRNAKDIKDMFSLNNKVYILTHASYDTRPGGDDTVNYDTSKVQIYCITSGNSRYLDYQEKWFFKTNPFNFFMPDLQRVTKIEVVVKGDGYSTINAYLLKENESPSDNNMIFTYNCARKLGVIRYYIRKSESLYHSLYIEGEGNADIHSIKLSVVTEGDKFESE